MKRFKNLCLFFLATVVLLPFVAMGQSYALPNGVKKQKVRFQLINNLIVIPVAVNGVELSFILDSGVNHPIVFNLADADSVQINNVREISINGLGDGAPMKGFSSYNNTFNIKKITNANEMLYVVLEKSLDFSSSLGIPIHGIIGFDLFRDFVVNINYHSKFITFFDPNQYRPKTNSRQQEFPLVILKNKAYVRGSVKIADDNSVPVNLMIDTGSSDAVWLFHNKEKQITVPSKFFEDFLGKGFNGNIYGKRTKVNEISFGNFTFFDAKAAFPEMNNFKTHPQVVSGHRNGSIGGELLKRFNLTFNYGDKTLVMRPNSGFKKPFYYNLSGLFLQHAGVRFIAERIADSRGIVQTDGSSYGNVQLVMENRTRVSVVPEIVVSSIRLGSPADEAGMQQGDVILAVNGKSVHSYKLQEVIHMLNKRQGKRMKILVERANQDLVFGFTLRKVFE